MLIGSEQPEADKSAREHWLPRKLHTLTFLSVVKQSRIIWEPDQQGLSHQRMSIRWVPGCGSSVPSNAVPGGVDRGTRLYVARASHAGSLVPGKLHPTYETVFVRWEPVSPNFGFKVTASFCAQLWRKGAHEGFRFRDLDWGGFPVEGS